MSRVVNMTDAQRLVLAYILLDIRDHTLRSIMGMIEGGEVAESDVVKVGGTALLEMVKNGEGIRR